MRGIVKKFGHLVANDNIDLLVEEGTIHGIIGENGAGKSTLMSILFGLYNQDHGVIKINGEEVVIKNPHDAYKYKIGMVHQHFKLVGIYNAIDNIILGNETLKFHAIIDRKSAKEKITKLAKKYNFDVNLNKAVEKLTIGQQQKIEILKTLFLDSDILIFDEPTAVLTPQEIEGFLKLLKEFKQEGKTIIIITHKLEEIKAVCDEATVIRRGQLIERFKVKEVSTKEMAKMMVGTDVVEVKNTTKAKLGDVVLELNDVSSKKLHNISFQVRGGEIVAVAGVEGNGQSELINIITGLEKFSKGRMTFNGFAPDKKIKRINKLIKREKDKSRARDLSDKLSNLKQYYANLDLANCSIQNRIDAGMAHIPEDRHKHGLLLDMKLKYGLAVKKTKEFSKFGILNEKLIHDHGRKIIEKYDVRGAGDGDAIARQLSGGNQQKAIIGREIESKHHFIVIAQPTRGLDVGAIKFAHEQIIKEKENGNAVFLVSYELSEIMALADRIIVLNKGNIVDIINAKNVKREEIGILMAGIKDGEELIEEQVTNG